MLLYLLQYVRVLLLQGLLCLQVLFAMEFIVVLDVTVAWSVLLIGVVAKGK